MKTPAMTEAERRFRDGIDSTPPDHAPLPGIFRHHKGGLYRVLGCARNSTNGMDRQWMVLYVSMTFGEMYVRELDEFTEILAIRGKPVPRFERLGLARQAPLPTTPRPTPTSASRTQKSTRR